MRGICSLQFKRESRVFLLIALFCWRKREEEEEEEETGGKEMAEEEKGKNPSQ